MKTWPVEAQLFNADGQTDRLTDMKIPIVAFRNFVTSKNNMENILQ
jgi:hypothetical protein